MSLIIGARRHQALAARFQRSRWSVEREQMAGMRAGEVLKFSAHAGNTVKSAARGLNDAHYGERQWLVEQRGADVTVTVQLILEAVA